MQASDPVTAKKPSPRALQWALFGAFGACAGSEGARMSPAQAGPVASPPARAQAANRLPRIHPANRFIVAKVLSQHGENMAKTVWHVAERHSCCIMATGFSASRRTGTG